MVERQAGRWAEFGAPPALTRRSKRRQLRGSSLDLPVAHTQRLAISQCRRNVEAYQLFDNSVFELPIEIWGEWRLG